MPIGNGVTLVQEPCDLVGLGLGANRPGGLAYVASTGRYYKLESFDSPPAPTADLSIISAQFGPVQPGCSSATPVGTSDLRWILQDGPNDVPAVSPQELAPDWYIDPVAGSDANSGITALEPLQTFKQLAIRWSTFNAQANFDITINVAAGSTQVAADDHVSIVRNMGPGFTVTLLGVLDALTSTDNSITAYTEMSEVSNENALVVGQDALAAPFDFSTYAGKFLQVTGQDVWSVIIKDDGLGQAYVTNFTSYSGCDHVTPTVVAPFDFSVVSAFELRNGDGAFPYVDVGQGSFCMKACSYNSSINPTERFGITCSGTVSFFECFFSRSELLLNELFQYAKGASIVRFDGCYIDDIYVVTSSAAVTTVHFSLLANNTQTVANFVGALELGPSTAIYSGTTLYPYSPMSTTFTKFSIDQQASNPVIRLQTGTTVYFQGPGALIGQNIANTHIFFEPSVVATYAPSSPSAAFTAVPAGGGVTSFKFGNNAACAKDPADLPFIANATASLNQSGLIYSSS